MGEPKVRTIRIHPHAPPKPDEGAPCNGCGVCCLAEPCPIGMVFSLRTEGECAKLRWHAQSRSYRCGLLESTAAVRDDVNQAGWKRGIAGYLHRTARRWIAAGEGCDCTMDDLPGEGAGG